MRPSRIRRRRQRLERRYESAQNRLWLAAALLDELRYDVCDHENLDDEFGPGFDGYWYEKVVCLDCGTTLSSVGTPWESEAMAFSDQIEQTIAPMVRAGAPQQEVIDTVRGFVAQSLDLPVDDVSVSVVSVVDSPYEITVTYRVPPAPGWTTITVVPADGT